MTRRELREHCFKMLFGTAFYPIEEADDQISHYFEAPDEDEQQEDGSYRVIHSAAFDIYDSDYVRGKVEKIIEKIPELDERINGVAEGWKTKRMGRVELAILRLALYEISFDDDIPEKGAINEAVELARKFGGDDSPAFVNGILAKLV